MVIRMNDRRSRLRQRRIEAIWAKIRMHEKEIAYYADKINQLRCNGPEYNQQVYREIVRDNKAAIARLIIELNTLPLWDPGGSVRGAIEDGRN